MVNVWKNVCGKTLQYFFSGKGRELDFFIAEGHSTHKEFPASLPVQKELVLVIST